MAVDEVLLERLREIFADLRLTVRELKMFGGLGVMHRGHMLCALWREGLIVRLGPAGLAEALAAGECGVFEPMKGKAAGGLGFVPDAAELDDEPLREWVERSAAFVDNLPPKKEF